MIDRRTKFIYLKYKMCEKQTNHYRFVMFDLDGTLTQERSIWEYIHKKLGKWYGFAELYQERFLAGEISYDQFCELDAMVWKGMSLQEVIRVAQTVPFYPGADELIGYMKSKGLQLGVVSSGLSVLSDWVHEKYGFDYSVSNELIHHEGVLSGKVNIRVHYDQKAVWVSKILGQFGVRPEQTIAIGDSLGDLDMLQMAGFSVAFNSSCADLDQIADVCIKDRNLAEIIPNLPL